MKRTIIVVVAMLFSLTSFAFNDTQTDATQTGLKATVDSQVALGVFPSNIGDSIKGRIDLLPTVTGKTYTYTAASSLAPPLYVNLRYDVMVKVNDATAMSTWSAGGTFTSFASVQSAIAAYVTAGTFPQAEADALLAMFQQYPTSYTWYSFSSVATSASPDKITTFVFGKP